MYHWYVVRRVSGRFFYTISFSYHPIALSSWLQQYGFEEKCRSFLFFFLNKLRWVCRFWLRRIHVTRSCTDSAGLPLKNRIFDWSLKVEIVLSWSVVVDACHLFSPQIGVGISKSEVHGIYQGCEWARTGLDDRQVSTILFFYPVRLVYFLNGSVCLVLVLPRIVSICMSLN